MPLPANPGYEWQLAMANPAGTLHPHALVTLSQDNFPKLQPTCSKMSGKALVFIGQNPGDSGENQSREMEDAGIGPPRGEPDSLPRAPKPNSIVIWHRGSQHHPRLARLSCDWANPERCCDPARQVTIPGAGAPAAGDMQGSPTRTPTQGPSLGGHFLGSMAGGFSCRFCPWGLKTSVRL